MTSDAEATLAIAEFRPDVVLTEVGASGVLMSTAGLPRDVGVPWLKKPIELDELLALLRHLNASR